MLRNGDDDDSPEANVEELCEEEDKDPNGSAELVCEDVA